MFDDLLERKKTFLDYNNKDLKKWKNCKGVSPESSDKLYCIRV